jgi:putative SOS response-associated peptidase YedK
MTAIDTLDPLGTNEWLDALCPVQAHSCIQRPPTSSTMQWTRRSTRVRTRHTLQRSLIQPPSRLSNDSPSKITPSRPEDTAQPF